MKMSDFINQLDMAVRELDQQQGNMLLELATIATADIKDRVIEQGRRADGRKFASPNNPTGYSRKPMLANHTGFWNKSGAERIAGSKSKRRDLKWVTIQRGGRNIKLFELEGGYEQFRELQGRRVDIVNFSLSGRMWANTNIKSASKNKVTIGGLTKETNDKLEGNTKRFGKILDLSETEVRRLKNDYVGSIVQILSKYNIR